LADGGEEESVMEMEIDPAFVAQWREEFPVLKHARPEFLPRAKELKKFCFNRPIHSRSH
jgi:predicted amidohydrolase